MTTDIKSCANIVKCIGTISEINIEFYPNGNIRGVVVLNKSMRVNLFALQHSGLYYNILETIGIPYHFISTVDKIPYELSEKPIVVGMVGSVKIMQDKKTVIKQVDLNRTSRPNKLFIIANMTEYGLQATYVARTVNKDYVFTNIQGVLCDNDVIFIPTETIIKVRYDKIFEYERGRIYDLSLVWDMGYDIDCNIISNVNGSGFRLVDIHETDMRYDTDTIDTLIKIYEFKKARAVDK